MVSITKEEKEKILERYPETQVVRTMRQKSKRHHYYVEEVPRVMRFLDYIRTCKILGAETE